MKTLPSFPLFFVSAALVCSGCAKQSGVNPAAPTITRLRQNGTREQAATVQIGRDVLDAKDLVRQIEYKNALLD